ncbi:hypothetical protein N9B44_00140 [bacterium]|nr:hypothetical protein [bacterium]
MSEHEVRKMGNLAVHEIHGEQSELVPQDPSDEPASELLKRIVQFCEAEEAKKKTANAASKEKSKRSKKTKAK